MRAAIGCAARSACHTSSPRTTPRPRDFLVSRRSVAFGPRWRRFAATDLDWSSCDVPEVRGTAEALLLAPVIT